MHPIIGSACMYYVPDIHSDRRLAMPDRPWQFITALASAI